jgi:hypothetical protein
MRSRASIVLDGMGAAAAIGHDGHSSRKVEGLVVRLTVGVRISLGASKSLQDGALFHAATRRGLGVDPCNNAVTTPPHVTRSRRVSFDPLGHDAGS